MRSQGLDAAVVAHAAAGKRVLGICGGLQMLGEALIDLHGVDGNAAGLGLLPVTTLFAQDKTVQRTEVRLPALPAPWQALEGMAASAMKSTMARPHRTPPCRRPDRRWSRPCPACCGTARTVSSGCYWHGLFENQAVLQALWGTAAPSLETVFARMAEGVGRWFERWNERRRPAAL
jgi:adenosylcobyric acid synthase